MNDHNPAEANPEDPTDQQPDNADDPQKSSDLGCQNKDEAKESKPALN